MRYLVLVAWLVSLVGLQAPAHAGPPTSRPVKATPKDKRQAKVFIKLRRLKRLLQHRTRQSFTGIVPKRAVFQGQFKKNWLRIQSTLTLYRASSQRAKWFAIGGRGGVIFDLSLNGQPQAPRRDVRGMNWVSLPASDKGTSHTVTFVYGIRVPSARGEHNIKLDLPQCGQATLSLQFKGKGWETRTLPASHVTLTEQPKGTHATLQLPGVARIQLYWKGKRIERNELTRLRATSETLLTLKEGLLQGKSHVQIDVLTGALRSVQLRLPAQVEVLHIGGNGVVEWFQIKQNKASSYRRYNVQLSRAVRKSQQMYVRFERAQKGKLVSLPQVFVNGVEQWNGLLGVQAKADTEVSHHQAKGAQQVDVRSLPSRIRQRTTQPILLAYRESQKTADIQVKMVRHPRLKVLSSIINRARFVTVRNRTGREVVKATYWITNNRRQFMPIRLPENALLTGAFVAGTPVQPAIDPVPVHSGKSGAFKGRWKGYLIPLIRSSKQRTQQLFTVEILYSIRSLRLRDWGLFRSYLPSTPLQILSYEWDYYLPRSHRAIWLSGTARTSWQRRFLKRLLYRMERDLKEGTPKLWAGGGKRFRRLNLYNKLGLKERFARKTFDFSSSNAPASASRSSYRSRFAKTQFQVRAQMPLVGERLRLRGHLVRNHAPFVNILYLEKELSQDWFWLVLFLTFFSTLAFLWGLFRPGPIRWLWAIISCLLLGGMFMAGYLLPLTYLAGFRGVMYGIWGTILLSLSLIPARQLWVSKGYLRFARWSSVFVTFLLLLFSSLTLQITLLFMAVPIYPALFRRSTPKGEKA